MAPTEIPFGNSTSINSTSTTDVADLQSTIENLIKDNFLYVIIGGGTIILCQLLICCYCICKHCNNKKKAVVEEEHMANNVLFGVGGNQLYRVQSTDSANNGINKVQLTTHDSYNNMDKMQKSPKQKTIKAPSPKTTIPQKISASLTPRNKKRSDSKTPLTAEDDLHANATWNTDTISTMSYNQSNQNDNEPNGIDTNNISTIVQSDYNQPEQNENGSSIVYSSNNEPNAIDTSNINTFETPAAINMDDIEMDEEESIDSEAETETQSENQNADEDVDDDSDSDSYDMFTPVPENINKEIKLKNNNPTDMGLDVIDEEAQNVNATFSAYTEYIVNDINANDTVIDMDDASVAQENVDTLNTNNDPGNDVNGTSIEADVDMDNIETNEENNIEENRENIAIETEETVRGNINEQMSESVDNKTVSKDDSKNALNALFGARKQTSNGNNDESENNEKKAQQIESIDSNVVSKNETKNVLNALFGARTKHSNVMDDKQPVTETSEKIENNETTNNVNNLLDIDNVEARTRTRTVDVQYAEDGQLCIAIHDFESSNADELNVTEGYKYIIVQGGKSDWWYVENDDNRQGWVPSTFLKPIK